MSEYLKYAAEAAVEAGGHADDAVTDLENHPDIDTDDLDRSAALALARAVRSLAHAVEDIALFLQERPDEEPSTVSAGPFTDLS